jgi:hypothetical protein
MTRPLFSCHPAKPDDGGCMAPDDCKGKVLVIRVPGFELRFCEAHRYELLEAIGPPCDHCGDIMGPMCGWCQ